MGDVIGDLNSRRGQIQGMDAVFGAQEIRAFVPLSEMFGYSNDLRSKTQGRGQLCHGAQPLHRGSEVDRGRNYRLAAAKKPNKTCLILLRIARIQASGSADYSADTGIPLE